MLPRVHGRGTKVGRLIRYLYGPGRHEEHVNPRLVAAWAGAGDLATLEPALRPDGRRDFAPLIDRLLDPLAAAERPPAQPVWHCSVRLAPRDRHRVLSDETWGHIAAELMAEIGMARHGDDDAVRWVAVRHNDDHIHIAATLVRQDGRTERAWNDKPRSVAACRALAARYGLYVVNPPDSTAARRPHPAELHKSGRLRRHETARDELRRRVRTAAAGAGTDEEFFARLRAAGVRVKLRQSTINVGQVTGYAVALAGFTTKEGEFVWYGGGRLAADLTLPRLRARWGVAPGDEYRPVKRPRVSPEARVKALGEAAAAVTAAAEEIRANAHSDPAAAQAAATAAADLLTTVAYALEGKDSGPISRAADAFDRAARDLYGRVVAATRRSYEMRAMARLVALLGRIAPGRKDELAALQLVMQMARLGESLDVLRDAQGRLHQAKAARGAADALRRAAQTRKRPLTTMPARRPAGAVPARGRQADRPTRRAR